MSLYRTYVYAFCFSGLILWAGCADNHLHKKSTTYAGSIEKGVHFPKGWQGTWHGELSIFSERNIQKAPMWVEIEPIDTSSQGRWTFGLVYGSKEKDWRPYELVPVDTAKGIWAVDEKNSIVMESYLRGPKFLCWFVVQGSRVLCTYELVGKDELIFEVLAGKEAPISQTGNSIHGLDTIPLVSTYPIQVFQRARLHRVPKK